MIRTLVVDSSVDQLIRLYKIIISCSSRYLASVGLLVLTSDLFVNRADSDNDNVI